MTHCNPAPPNPDGVAMAMCWSPEALIGVAAIGVLALGLMAYRYPECEEADR